ncbi:MAG TPA: hypothetical protein PKD64_06090 [Pirellulaceae bacterium]|nr:hypothetical protein [Pirellulaceae bacterium]HMO91750.1 hypothetical protein [Pirellulaceae bacterium]HMP69549.1 hypothetical protein [Pirellulaceae bacterium]
MNTSKQFIRKIIYILIITGLLIPLSLIGRPSTRNSDNTVVDQGGVLSRTRNETDLSIATLSQIDPASESMKLGSLGLRGLAANLLWMQVLEAKEKKEWDVLSASLDTLVKLQPNFIEVWKFQAHNLSYNISVEFDDYEYRYQWVRNGIDFLTQGISANKRDHRIQNELGRFSGQKFGTADERFQYRRLFRTDNTFHERMGAFVNVNNLDTQYGRDNWLLAHEWYRVAEDMIDRGVDGLEVRLRISAPNQYQQKPAQRRNMMLSLNDEIAMEREFMAEQWDRASREWIDYGKRKIIARGGFTYSLEQEGAKVLEVRRLREQLDALAPGARAEIFGNALQEAVKDEVIRSQDMELLSRPYDQLEDRELASVQVLEGSLFAITRDVERKIAERSSPEDRTKAFRLVGEILTAISGFRSAEQDRSIWNYGHWRSRNEAEATDTAISARQAEFDASEHRRNAIFVAYTEVNPVTGEKERIPGAIESYEQAFRLWAQVFKDYPELTDGTLVEEIIDVCREYSGLRLKSGMPPWIPDHPLQAVVDEYAIANQEPDLFTSDKVRTLLQLEELQQSSIYGLPPRPQIEFEDFE